MSGHAKRVDGNQASIVAGLRAAGVWVWDTHELGGGWPDLVTWEPIGGYRLVEVKAPGGRFTEPEREFYEGCPGPIHVVDSVECALVAHGIEIEGGQSESTTRAVHHGDA